MWLINDAVGHATLCYATMDQHKHEYKTAIVFDSWKYKHCFEFILSKSKDILVYWFIVRYMQETRRSFLLSLF